MIFGIWLAERLDSRFFVKAVDCKRKRSSSFSEKLAVLNSLKNGPIAESAPSANKQHYEVPYFKKKF